MKNGMKKLINDADNIEKMDGVIRMMKKSAPLLMILSLIIVLAMSAASVFADSDTYLPGASIRVSMISQDPDPVNPGEYVELRWMITNMGSKPIENVEFRLVPEYPFQLLGLDDGVKKLGTIQGNQKGEEGVVLYYKLRVDADASEGVNKLKLMYNYDNSDWATLDDFDVRVQSVDAAIVIDDVVLEPKMLSPGNEGKLTINIKNLADSVMKDVNVKLDLTLSSIPLSAASTEAATLYDALPFATTTSSNEKRVTRIDPGEDVSVSFDMMVYPSAISRVYKVPIIMTYKDELENEYTKTGIIGIVVGSEPDIYVVIDTSDLVAGAKSGKVSFKFVNRGVTDIKFLDVILEETDDYKVISANEEYIGNIDSDDYDSVEFSLYLSNNKDPKTNGVLEFPIHITFKDANNIDYAKDLTLTYRINTAEQKGQAKSQSGIIIIVVIVVMLIGWIVYRRWDKKRKKPSS